MEVCNTKGQCCSTPLADPSKDDREKGKVDKYDTASMLGECFNTNFWGDLTATLSKDGSDGWYVDWAAIKFGSGRSFTCTFNNWLDNDTGYSNNMTAGCTEGRIFHLAFVIN